MRTPWSGRHRARHAQVCCCNHIFSTILQTTSTVSQVTPWIKCAVQQERRVSWLTLAPAGGGPFERQRTLHDFLSPRQQPGNELEDEDAPTPRAPSEDGGVVMHASSSIRDVAHFALFKCNMLAIVWLHFVWFHNGVPASTTRCTKGSSPLLQVHHWRTSSSRMTRRIARSCQTMRTRCRRRWRSCGAALAITTGTHYVWSCGDGASSSCAGSRPHIAHAERLGKLFDAVLPCRRKDVALARTLGGWRGSVPCCTGPSWKET